MIIRTIIVGSLECNCLIVSDETTNEAFIVDPGDEPDRIADMVHENSLAVKYIVCTHAHFDHIGAIPELKELTKAQIVLHKDEVDVYEASESFAKYLGFDIESLPAPDILVAEGEIIKTGGMSFSVFHTPGHTPGGICLYGEGIIITGDTLFAGSVGRTDLPGGDIKKLRKSFQRLMGLDGKIRVVPGHGPETTIGDEREYNFFAKELF
jgi:glyoxylase-like metal-dependent hydrolase (beta-lactamase superfamily II)